MKNRKSRTEPTKFNGLALVAAMFRQLDPPFRETLSKKIEAARPGILNKIDQLQFQYEDLFRLEDRSIQLLLRQINESEWLIAWHLSSEKLRERLLSNMSATKKEDFLFAAKKHPPVHRDKIEAIKIKITSQAYQLLIQGKLKIKSRRILREIQENLEVKKIQSNSARGHKRPA